MPRFLHALTEGVLLADGGMGSTLHQVANLAFRTPDEVNLLAPDAVLAVHLDHLRAGARVIETNTFGANAVRLASLGLASEVRALNHRAVKLAREARDLAAVDAFVAGSIGPTGLRFEGSAVQREAAREAWKAQADALEDRGVDLFILETFPTTLELEVALDAVRSVSSLPIVAQMTVAAREEWSDDVEHDPAVIAELQRLAQLPADVIGLNCSLGPGQILPFLRMLAGFAQGRPLAVQPNSGLPRREGGRFLYPSADPAYFARFATEAVGLGARLVGGCCGTTPQQIAAMAGALRTALPGTVPARAAAPSEHAPASTDSHSDLARKLAAGEFVVSVQVDPPKGTGTGLVLEACEAFRASGKVDVVDVNSNPMARLHMDALWMSAAIEARGMPTIAHYTPRDASLMGIEGNLLGAWRAGVRNVLAITGDPSMARGEPGAGDVYQTDSIGLVRAISELNAGLDCFGNRIGDPPSFTIGVAVNPNHEDLDAEVERFRRKVEAGAHFAMTQVFFEWSCWERFLDRLGGTTPIPVLAAIWPLTSFQLALRLHHEVPGILVPDDVLARLEAAGPSARQVGFDLARTMLDGARDRTAGVYIIAPFKRPAAALELFSDS